MEKIELKLIKVSDRLYYLPHYEKNDWCTVALVIGDNHVMMLDSGASRRHVEMFMQQLEENSLSKPDLCFLTHWHWDHTYGLAHIDGVTSFATKATNDLLKKMQGWGWSDEEMKERLKTGEDLEFSYPHINDEYPDKSQIKIASATVTTVRWLIYLKKNVSSWVISTMKTCCRCSRCTTLTATEN